MHPARTGKPAKNLSSHFKNLTMKFNDYTIINFGAHKGKTLKDVPAKYLLYLESEIQKNPEHRRSKRDKAILEYCKENKDVLESEL